MDSVKKYCIYCYTNKINGKQYIGQTCRTLKERAGSDGCHYIMKNGAFGNAIKRYGWSNFVPEILEDGLSLEQANEREQYWIAELNTLAPNGYNLDKGGLNKSTHESTKQKISKNNARYWKGKHLSDEAKEKLRQFNIGRKHSEESKRRRKETYKLTGYDYGRGKHRPPEAVAKIAEMKKRPVEQFTKDMVFVAEYPSIKEAIQQTGVGHISECCLRKPHCNTAGGYIWRFKGDESYTPRENACNKRVFQFTKDGDFIAEYPSAAEAGRHLGLSKSQTNHINDCCNGKRESSAGFVWKYKEVA